MDDVALTIVAFELASAGLTSSKVSLVNSSEKYFMELRNHAQAIALCKEVLRVSRQPEARFYAVNTIRAVAGLHWYRLDATDKVGESCLKNVLIQHCMAYIHDPVTLQSLTSTKAHSTPTSILTLPAYGYEAYERRADLSCAAYLMRAGYLEEPQEIRFGFVQQMKASMLIKTESLNACLSESKFSLWRPAIIAAEFMLQAINEFSSEQATGSESHHSLTYQARKTVTKQFAAVEMPQIFEACVACIQNVYPAVSSIPSSSSSVCHKAFVEIGCHVISTCIECITTIMSSGSFSDPSNGLTKSSLTLNRKSEGGGSTADEQLITRPGAVWRPLVDELGSLITSFMDIYDFFNHHKNHPLYVSNLAAENLCGKIRSYVICVTAVHTESFTSIERAHQHVVTILSLLNSRKWHSSSNREERVTLVDAWKRLSCAHCLLLVFQGTGISVDVYQELHTITTLQLSMLADSEDADTAESVLAELIDPLLEVWLNLVYELQDYILVEGLSDPRNSALFECVSRHVSTVVLNYLEKSLAEAAKEDKYADDASDDHVEEMEDLSAEESRIETASKLIRFSASSGTLQYVSEHVLFRAQQYVTLSSYPNADQINQRALLRLHEESYFLVSLLGGVLADHVEQEVPSVPEEFAELASNPAAHPGKLALQAAMDALLQLVEAENMVFASRKTCILSPRVSAALVEALARITGTWLYPSREEEPVVYELVGKMLVLRAQSTAINKVILSFKFTSGEFKLSTATGNLLVAIASSLGQSRAVDRFPESANASAWDALMQAPLDSYISLPPAVVRKIGFSLISLKHGDNGSMLVRACSDYLDRIWQSLVTGDISVHADVILNVLRGVIQYKRNIPLEFRKVFMEFIMRHHRPLLQRFGASHPKIGRHIIRLLDEYTKINLAEMTIPEGGVFFGMCFDLVDELSAIMKAQPSYEEVDIASNLKCVLRLFESILDRDPQKLESVDPSFSGQGSDPSTTPCGDSFMSRMIYLSLSVVQRHMSTKLLSYPKLSQIYFNLVANVLEYHPKVVIRLPALMANQAFWSLECMFSSPESLIQRKALRCISAMCAFHIKELVLGQTGFGPHFAEHFAVAILEAHIVRGAFTVDGSEVSAALLALMHIDERPEFLFLCLGNLMTKMSDGLAARGCDRTWLQSVIQLKAKPLCEEFVARVFQLLREAREAAGTSNLPPHIRNRNILTPLSQDLDRFTDSFQLILL